MVCALCGQESREGISDEKNAFCCFGCRTVWHLLDARGALDGYETHPIFQQALSSGFISNPHLKIEPKTFSATKRVLWEIREMWCPSCAEVIQYLMRLEKGVSTCHIDYATDLASIEYDPCQISEEALFSFIKRLGYQPLSLEGILGKPVSLSLYLRFFVAAFAALNVMMLSYPLYATYFNSDHEGWGPILIWISLAFSVPVLTYSAWPIFRRFYHSLMTGLFGMESLVVLGSGAAFLLSLLNMLRGRSDVYFDTLTVLIAFMLLGKIIEAKAKFTAKESFYTLARSLPQRVRKEGKFIPIKEIQVGDDVEVVTGESIPLDGIVSEGEAWVSEACVTGEPLPKLKKTGDRMNAGSIVESGRLYIKVQDTTSSLDRLLAACQLNLEHKAHYVPLLDPLARYYVPFLVLLSLIVSFTVGFDAALATLLISCPCAIGIAAPLVESRLFSSFAAKGALVRNRGILGKLPKVSCFAFDKTGTITEGTLKVGGLSALKPETRAALKGLAANSLHPIARALTQEISETGKTYFRIFETEGAGIEGDGAYLGSSAFLSSKGIKTPPSSDEESEVYFYFEGATYRLTLTDQIRPEIASLMGQLPNPLLLSGDRLPSVAAIAKQAGISAWQAELSPTGKKEAIAVLQKKGETVLFAGDGLNDAPALTQADIGVAVKSSLTLSQAAADMVLTTSLNVLPELVDLAKKGRRLIFQNLFWAFFYNVLALPLAILGVLSPLTSAIAMTASSLIIIFNSIRLR